IVLYILAAAQSNLFKSIAVMKVFIDVFTGDELCSDSYPMKVIDDVYYEVEGKNIVESNDIVETLLSSSAAASLPSGALLPPINDSSISLLSTIF
ncbi:unnamed protein product, partial [Rotaria socialis]